MKPSFPRRAHRRAVAITVMMCILGAITVWLDGPMWLIAVLFGGIGVGANNAGYWRGYQTAQRDARR